VLATGGPQWWVGGESFLTAVGFVVDQLVDPALLDEQAAGGQVE
jgi:hypothetical protein